MKIILASSSPRRRELLSSLGVEFEIIPSNADEVFDKNLNVYENVEDLALKKAAEVSEKCNFDCMIIGSDTVVEIDGKVLGKPTDNEDAQNMLNLLSGREHQVITGVAIILKSGNNIKKIKSHETTQVKFKKLSENDINKYIASGEPFDKAGAYAIQGFGVTMVEKINGCYTNVVGLPLFHLNKIIKEEFSIELW